jgi:hypothetical protein
MNVLMASYHFLSSHLPENKLLNRELPPPPSLRIRISPPLLPYFFAVVRAGVSSNVCDQVGTPYTASSHHNSQREPQSESDSPYPTPSKSRPGILRPLSQLRRFPPSISLQSKEYTKVLDSVFPAEGHLYRGLEYNSLQEAHKPLGGLARYLLKSFRHDTLQKVKD